MARSLWIARSVPEPLSSRSNDWPLFRHGSSRQCHCVQEIAQKACESTVMVGSRHNFSNGAMIGLTILVASVGLPALAQADSLTMLRTLSKGEWTIKHRDGSPDRKICVRSGEELIQLRHGNQGCSRFVVEDAANRITVQYTCPGNGYGRTNIRKEAGALVQIESQGISSGIPFQFAAEGRRTGDC